MKESRLTSWEAENFFHWNWKKILSPEDFRSYSIHVCLNKEKICITHLLKNKFYNVSKNKKRFTVLNKDEILAEEVKKFPSLYDKSSRSYRQRCRKKCLNESCWKIRIFGRWLLIHNLLLTHNFPKPHEYNILNIEVYVQWLPVGTYFELLDESTMRWN